MSLLNVIILAIVQGFAELLPVSSSAHVVVAEKLLGLDPSSPPMTLLLVMLHTGTMLAVIVYFWPQWRSTYFQSADTFKAIAVRVIVATLLTAAVGEALIKIIEKTLLRAVPHSEIEDLFSHLEFIAPALALAGFVILCAGFVERRRAARNDLGTNEITTKRAALVGMVQGLCLPFRGFSRSGATISAGMLLGIAKARAEAFSFALAVVITPPVVAREVMRLVRSPQRGRRRPRFGRAADSARRRGGVFRGAARVEMAEPMARERALVALRHLLPVCRGRRDLSASRRILGRPARVLHASIQA